MYAVETRTGTQRYSALSPRGVEAKYLISKYTNICTQTHTRSLWPQPEQPDPEPIS